MHHFVMAQRQDKIFAEGIKQAESDVFVMMPAMHRIARHIFQRVMHEAHIPFEAEAQPAVMDGACHPRPGGGFFRHGEKPWMGAIDGAVGGAQKFHRLPIFPPALFIGNPFAAFAGIVAIKHRGHRIDPEAINMIALGPEQGIVDQEGRHFAPPEIVDGGVPVGMKAQPRVFMLIERGAVEMRQAMFVGGKMRRHPIDQYPQSGAMRAFDKTGKAFRLAKTRARRIQAGGLIAPAGVEGMLADRQEFDMGETHLRRIRD